MKQSSPFLILTAGILWGTMGLFVRRLNALGLNTIDIVALRSVMTAAVMALVLAISNRKLLHIRVRDIWCFLGTGLLSIVFFNYCYFRAITMMSMSVAAVLLYTAPVIVMMLSAFLFREKITSVKVIALVGTILGCVFVTGVFGDSASLSGTGILVGLGAGLGYALYSIFSRFALERGYHSMTITFYTFLIAGIGIAPAADLKKICLVCAEDVGVAGFYVIFALVSTVVPYLFYTAGMKGMENGTASIIASVEPVAAAVIGVLWFEEQLTRNHIIGMLLVLGSIVICNIRFKKK